MDYIISFECPNADSLAIMARIKQEGPKHIDNGCYVFNPRVPLHDDVHTKELWLSHADDEGGTALAPDCMRAEDAERRVKLYVHKDSVIVDTQAVQFADDEDDYWRL